MDKILFALNLVVDFIDVNNFVDERVITDYLLFAGLEDHEIRQVLAVLDITKKEPSETGVRIFSRSEKRLFTIDAENYINKLIITGVIDLISAEDIIEKAFELEPETNGKISIEQIKGATLMMLIEKRTSIMNNKILEDYIH